MKNDQNQTPNTNVSNTKAINPSRVKSHGGKRLAGVRMFLNVLYYGCYLADLIVWNFIRTGLVFICFLHTFIYNVKNVLYLFTVIYLSRIYNKINVYKLNVLHIF